MRLSTRGRGRRKTGDETAQSAELPAGRVGEPEGFGPDTRPARSAKRAERRARHVILLGPQTLEENVAGALGDPSGAGRVATITAGWQERESEDEALDLALGGGTVNLKLYERAESVAEEDPELATARRSIQDRLKLLRRAYNVRLARLMEAFAALEDFPGDATILDPERAAALDAIRLLDRRQAERIGEMRDAFDRRFSPHDRPSIRRHRREIAEVLRDAGVIVVAGGHVAVLLNRLNLFGLGAELAGRKLIAWSAGAMALSPLVVLFHDSPPQGPGNAEVLESGLDLFPVVVPLPYASRRLRADDLRRMSRFARRFAPQRCVFLDAGTRIEWKRGGWRAVGEAREIAPDGRTVTMATTKRQGKTS